ncbi:hypothetical protein Aoki45_03840 [Algoriphagus sp. oki45]|uniref:hypothetical protein n=1 Tax=Algoriphagus sp. oki45 TaxID=3067294 RepID=UPI0027ECB50E|nr:hypothetical protein Aoki45_03840 [Algoriphagus sp. oki45]
MKKYLLTIGIGAMLIQVSCDSLQQDEVLLEENQALLESEELATGEENLRKKGNVETTWKVEKAERFYRMTENTYYLLPSNLPLEKVNRAYESTRSDDQFVEEMIKESLKVFDSNIFNYGKFLSPLSRRNHQALAADEHEVEYNILAAKFNDEEEALASMAGYLKIEDIDGESTESKTYPIFKIVGNPSTQSGDDCKGKGSWCDSVPPVRPPQLEEMVDFLPVLKRYGGQPNPTQAALNELKSNTGLDPVAIALLLPAVQKIADLPSPNADKDHSKWIPIQSVGRRYGVDMTESVGTFLAFGVGGSVFGLINEKYDASGDMDWAAVQLNRRRFEFEMWLFWSRWAEAKKIGSATQGSGSGKAN